MPEDIITLKEEHQAIIKTYSLIRLIFFKYMIFYVCLIIGTLLVFWLYGKTDLQTYKEPEMTVIKKNTLVNSFNKFMKQTVDSSDMEVFILQGPLSTSGDYIQSKDNLISYKGYIVPRFFSLHNKFPLKPMEYFLSGNYDIIKLKEFVQNVVFLELQKSGEINRYGTLPVASTLIDTFNLSCVFKSSLFQGTCGYYINEFINNFFVYELKQDYKGLQELFTQISKDKERKEQFCSNMEKYILYSNDINSRLEPIFKSCGTRALENFATLQTFIEIQNELKAGYFSSSVYYNDKLNIYKLLCIQQILYNDFSENRFNERNMSTYIEYFQRLLRKTYASGFYMDTSYWFNNYYITQQLQNNIYESKSLDIEKAIKGLNSINNGSDLMGFKGLNGIVINKELMLKIDEQNSIENIKKIPIENLFKLVDKNQFFTTVSKQIDEKGVSFSGYFTNISNMVTKVNAFIRMEEKNNSLFVKYVDMKGYPKLNDFLYTLVNNENVSLSLLYEYILKNFSLYANDGRELSFCDILTANLSKSNASTTKCNTSEIVISKVILKTAVEYKIHINEYNIIDIDITDPEIQKAVKEQLSGVKTDMLTLPQQILTIVTYEPIKKIEVVAEELEGSLVTIEKIRNFMGITPDVKKSAEGIVADFDINGIKFSAIYDIKTNILGPLYFRDVFLKDGRTIMVKNFSLTMDEQDQERISQFLLDPIAYIKSINSAAYILYNRYKPAQ